MNTFARSTRLFFAQVILGATLFAHVAHAAEACVAPMASPAMAFGDMQDPGCASNPNNCLDQCAEFDQAAPQVKAAAATPTDLVIALLPKFEFAERPAASDPVLCTFAAPPSRLRFCTFLF